MAKPSVSSATSAAAISAARVPGWSRAPVTVTGPRPSSRPRTSSTRASSGDHVRAYAAGATIAGSSAACGPQRLELAAGALRRSTGRPVWRTQPRDPLFALSWTSHSRQPALATSASVRKPSQTSASCSSSAFAGSGQASARTRSIASASSRPMSDARSGSSQRRLITACVRRSSSGASSR